MLRQLLVVCNISSNRRGCFRLPDYPIGTATALTATEPGCAHGRPARISWARLLKRVFEIDLEHCPNCGGQLKIQSPPLWRHP